MSIDLYFLTIMTILGIAIVIIMLISMYFENALIFLISGLLSCVIALIAATPAVSFDVFSHTSSTSQISVQEISKISPKDNSDTLFNVTYTDVERIEKEITVKEIVYDSDITYIEKTRKTFLFLYEDNYVLHEPQKFINNNN